MLYTAFIFGLISSFHCVGMCGPLVIAFSKTKKDPEGTLKFNCYLITEDQIKTIDNRAKGDADASAEFADASPYPDPSELMDDIYWETDNPEEKTSQGTMFFETPA